MATYALADGNTAAISDEDGIHSGGTFTVPAAWNGRRVRMQFQTLSEISGATLYQTLLNGASHDGAAAQYAEDVNTTDRINAVSAPVVVSAGDVFTTSGTLGASAALMAAGRGHGCGLHWCTGQPDHVGLCHRDYADGR